MNKQLNGVHEFETTWAGKILKAEIGKLAQQALSSVSVRYGDTLVLATVTRAKKPREGIDFFPLSVDYEEKLYAAGKIKGSRFIKREGRPTDEAIITGRMIDRSIRPLFNNDDRCEVQVIIEVFSVDQQNDPDIVALAASSIALSISGISWQGPIVGVRVGQVEGNFIINPTYEEREKSKLDLIAVGSQEKITMIETLADEIPEDLIFKAIEFAAKNFSPVLKLIDEIKKKIGQIELTEIKGTITKVEDDVLRKKLTEFLSHNLDQYLFSAKKETKRKRKESVEKLKEALSEYLIAQGFEADKIIKALIDAEKEVEHRVSEAILKEEKRIDGRALDEIRPLSMEIGLLPRTHGSALFNRGETQILSVVTLGAPSDEQTLDGMEESGKKRYMHHYNFLPFATGETGGLRGPGRREIGHGSLAEKALLPVLPDKESFPYTIRIVSEVLGSNGSSSMGSVCGSSLALMDAGAPIKKAVAGIAMGLASDDKGDYKIITDLQDLEDGKGGMDFKVAGTIDGVTAIQMDTKTKGLSFKIIKETLERARKARLEILEKMNEVIKAPRPDLSAYAPRIISFRIDPDKIRDVIGPGGKVINEIIDKTGVTIDIEDDGLVMICSVNLESSNKAVEWIKNITRKVEVGEVFQGRVTRILNFGAFIEILPGQEGMVHISELAHYRVNKVEDIVNIGDIISVKVIKIDEMGRINLSLKATQPYSEDKSNFHNKNTSPDSQSGFRRKIA